MPVKSIALAVLAFALLGLGVVGLFLPILQGVLFISAGLFILCAISPRFKARFDALMLPYPRAKTAFDRLFVKAAAVFRFARRTPEQP